MDQSSVDRHYANASRAEQQHYKTEYKGVPMLCEEGLHEEIAALIGSRLEPGQKVLDVGCGQGALSLRLHDQGLAVEAVDMYDHFKPKGVVPFTQSRAEDAVISGPYDCVFMVEIIEHVESPFALLRKYAAQVKPGGYLVVTTPNVDSDLSRAWFFLKGRHWYFEEQRVADDGHITPVHQFQMRYMCEKLGLSIVEQRNVLENRTVAPGALWGLARLLKLYQRARGVAPNEGKISVYLLRKDAAAATAGAPLK